MVFPGNEVTAHRAPSQTGRGTIFRWQIQIGAIAGILYQFENDESTFADARDGFKGRSVAVGPLVKYKAIFDKGEIDFGLSWAHEFEVENRVEGNAVFLSASGKF